MQVAEGEFEGLEGTQKAIATWDIDQQDPARMNVTFVSSKILPTHPQDLDRWKAAFAESNSLVSHPLHLQLVFVCSESILAAVWRAAYIRPGDRCRQK